MNPRVPLPDPLGSGPFSYSDALARGLLPGRLRGPDLRKPFRGSRDPGTATDIVARSIAYRPVMRHDAFFCSVTAAVITGVPVPARFQHDRVLHVAVPHPTRAPEGKGIRGHSVHVLEGDVRDRTGLPVSSPERLWCELSAVLTVPQLVAAGDHLVQRYNPATSIERLAAASAAFSGRAGVRRRIESLPLLDGASESPMESELRVIIIVAKIPGLVANLSIQLPAARYRADLAFPHKKVIVEYQSEYHFDPAQRRRDMTRIDRLQAEGWFVMQVNLDDLNDPDELVARIRSVLDSRPTV